MKTIILIISILFFATFTAKSQTSITFGGSTLSSVSNTVELNLTQGQALNITGTTSGWYLDPDYINADGSFAAITGKYKVAADFSLQYFRIFPMKDSELAHLNEDCTGTIWINGDGFGKPSLSNNANWWAGEPRTLAMAPIGNKKYRLTLVAGRTIRTGGSLNMRFNKQINNTIEGNVSPSLKLQGIGSDIVFRNTADGSQLSFNNGVNLPIGTKLVFTVDLSNGLNNATLAIDRSNLSVFGNLMTKIDSNSYRFEGILYSGIASNIAGIYDISNWYLDPDYFDANGNFNSLTGKYRITADFNLKYFRIAPMIGNTLATLQSNNTGTIWVCGQGIGKPAVATNNADWFAGEEKSVAMTPIGNQKYRLTLVAGQTLSVDKINIRFNRDLTSNTNLCDALTLTGTATNSLIHKNSNDGNQIVLNDNTVFEYGTTYTFTFDAAANTLTVVKEGQADNRLNIQVFGKQLYRVSDFEYVYNGSINNGDVANISGIKNIAEWWLDPDYFDDNGKFNAVTGEYRLIANLRLKYFRIIPLIGGKIASLQTDGSGTVWVVGGNAIGKPSITSNESSWNFADMTKAIAMCPIGNKVYRLTLDAPQNVNVALCNLIFYKSLADASSVKKISDNITLVGDFTKENFRKNPLDGNHIYFQGNKGLDFGVRYVYTLDLSNGIENAMFKVTQTPLNLPTTNDTHAYKHFILYGQSLSVGYDSWMSLSTENVNGNYMIGDQVWIQPHMGATNFREFKPLVSTPAKADSLVAECPVTSTVNYIRKRQESENPNENNRFIATSCGVGGTSIEQLSKNYVQKWLYYNYYQSLVQGKKLASLSGSTIECPAVFWMQGESDYDYQTSKTAYKERFVQLKNDMQNDAQTVYGQLEKPLFITYQVGHQWQKKPLQISMAQLEATNENEDMICAGPVYQMTDWGGHLDANGTRWIGEMLGKVYWQTKILGKKFIPLQPNQLLRDTNNPNKVIIKFYSEHFPLVLDANTLRKVRNYGFEVFNNDVSQTITDVSVVNNTVVITCQNNLTGKIDVSYAGENADYLGGTGGKGHGNLRDSDPATGYFDYINQNLRNGNGNYVYPHYKRDLSNYTPASGEPKDEAGNVIYNKKYPLYNFCVAFFHTIAVGENDYKVPIIYELKTGVNRTNILPITIFSNPVKDVLKIQSPEGVQVDSVEIVNMAGSVLYKNSFVENEINVSVFPAGIYLLKINADKNCVYTSKIIKE